MPAPCRRTSRRTCPGGSRTARPSARFPSCRRRCSRGSTRATPSRGRRRRRGASFRSCWSIARREDAATVQRARSLAPTMWSTRCGLHPDAVVRDRRVRRGELDRRDRDALSDRDVADRRARPVRRQESRALAGEVDARSSRRSRTAPSTASAPTRRDTSPAIVVGADVRRALEDLRDRASAPSVRLGVVDDVVGDLQRVRDA